VGSMTSLIGSNKDYFVNDDTIVSDYLCSAEVPTEPERQTRGLHLTKQKHDGNDQAWNGSEETWRSSVRRGARLIRHKADQASQRPAPSGAKGLFVCQLLRFNGAFCTRN
jgi:hypothetical protein